MSGYFLLGSQFVCDLDTWKIIFPINFWSKIVRTWHSCNMYMKLKWKLWSSKSCDMTKDRKWTRKRQERIFLSGIYFISGQWLLYYEAKLPLAMNAKPTKLPVKPNFANLSVFVLQLHTKSTNSYRFLMKVFLRQVCLPQKEEFFHLPLWGDILLWEKTKSFSAKKKFWQICYIWLMLAVITVC